MSHKLSIELDGTGVTITFSGIVEADEIRELHKQIESHESFPQWRYQIWDFSNAEKLNFSFDHLRQFALEERFAASINPKQRLAIIPRKSTHVGLDRTYNILEQVWGAWESKTFWDIDTARVWAKSGHESDNHDT